MLPQKRDNCREIWNTFPSRGHKTNTYRHDTQKLSKSRISGCLLGFLSLLRDFLAPFLLLQPLLFLVLAVEGLRPSSKQLPESHQLIPQRVQLKAARLSATKVSGHTLLPVLRVFEMSWDDVKRNIILLEQCFFNDASNY